MPERKFKEIHADEETRLAAARGIRPSGPPKFLTTEAEFDKPKVGDVRIEEGRARNPDGSVDMVRRAFKVYRRIERSERGEHGFYVHAVDHPDALVALRDNPGTPDNKNKYFGTAVDAWKKDKDGFILDPDTGKRIQRYTDDHAEVWELVSEHADHNAALARAQEI